MMHGYYLNRSSVKTPSNIRYEICMYRRTHDFMIGYGNFYEKFYPMQQHKGSEVLYCEHFKNGNPKTGNPCVIVIIKK